MKQRIVTGLIGGAGFLFLVYYGGTLYSLFIALLAVIGYYELLKMDRRSVLSIEGIVGIITVLSIIFTQNPIFDFFNGISTITVLVIAISLYLIIVVVKKNHITFDEIGYLLLGIIYVGFGFAFMIATRLSADGLLLTLLVLFSTWASDSGAYFTGMLLGKHKLWPEISPKKTIEGSIGGVIFAIAAAVLTNYFIGSFYTQTVVLIGFIVAIIGQMGDLVESALKRSKNVKDSGTLLPGHGGVLDRFDSLIFVFPIFYLLQFV